MTVAIRISVGMLTGLMTSMLWGVDLVVTRGPEALVLQGAASIPPEPELLVLERSINLRHWTEIGRFRGALAPYEVQTPIVSPTAFFRISSRRQLPSDDWANQLLVPWDDLIFRPQGLGLSGAPFVKFTMELDDRERVYFQDSATYPFHFQFIRDRIPAYENIDLARFEDIALRLAGQELLLGTVILAPDPTITEAAIQFAGQEAFPAERVAEWFWQVRRRIVDLGGDWRYFYIPSFEQRTVAFENEAFFREQGIAVDTSSRWASETVCYSPGWALGRLVFVPATEIDAAFGSGRLTPSDILVTDAIPAEIPVLAGVITFQPATPNSHVVLLARSFNVPFVFASGAALQAKISDWNGQEVLLVVSDAEGQCELEINNVEGKLSDEERQAILALKSPPMVEIQPKENADALWYATDGLTPSDIRFVGGKAANFGALRRAIPDHSPESISFSFNLWDAFMDQRLVEGTPLRDWIQSQLLTHREYPPVMPLLREALGRVRSAIVNDTTFEAELEWAVVEALRSFDAGRKIRFRSSTNVEDSEHFIGAGLYDSFSGCLHDDLDFDSVGPSHCDLNKKNERGVFRAIRKVFASFYNENAYLERLRHGVAEEEVAMGLLVHHSFPDELELANGVATLDLRIGLDGQRLVEATLVTQAGPVSVSNPDSESLPEVVHMAQGDLTLEEASSLVVPRETVLEWEVEYRELFDLLDRAAIEFATVLGEWDRLLLDFEFKKTKPDGLVVKQIRAIPLPRSVEPPQLDF